MALTHTRGVGVLRLCPRGGPRALATHQTQMRIRVTFRRWGCLRRSKASPEGPVSSGTSWKEMQREGPGEGLDGQFWAGLCWAAARTWLRSCAESSCLLTEAAFQTNCLAFSIFPWMRSHRADSGRTLQAGGAVTSGLASWGAFPVIPGNAEPHSQPSQAA